MLHCRMCIESQESALFHIVIIAVDIRTPVRH